ncbi:MAG: Ig-like domain-containing protein [Acidobacteriota bacterium]|nr:Ig-like domain-containing protein [Acidobacteriota bacterium]
MILDGPTGQSIGGSAATTFNALTISSAGTGAVLGQNATVNGTLTLNNNLTTGANILIQPSTAPASVAGLFDVIGSVRRTGSPLPSGVGLTFGNQNNIINFTAAGTRPTDVTITLVKAAPATFTSAVQRTYTIAPTGGSGYSATLRLRYLEGELNGNVESQLDLWRFNGATFIDEQQTARDAVNNWVEKSGVTAFSDWTFATHVNQAPSVTPNPAATIVGVQTSAIVLDRQVIDAASVTHFKITGITNGTLFKSDGLTQINNNDFITYAEGTAGVKFTPNSVATGSFTVQASSDASGTGLSPGTTGTINVSQGTTTTTITSDLPEPSNVGQVVTVNYTVAVLTGSGTPTGTVTVTVSGGAETCNGTVAAGTCNITLTASGSRTLTATYAGDSNFVGGNDTEPHDVVGPPDAIDDNYSTFKNTPLNIGAPGVLGNDTGSPSVSAVGGCADVTAPFAGCLTLANGTVTVNADGSFSYTAPSAVFVGADSFTYTATNAGGSDTATVNITVADSFFINEVLFDPPGTDAPNEYIEFRGPASATIPSGTYLVVIDGDSANAGGVTTIINLSGLTFGSNGFLVLLQYTNTYTTTAGATVLTSTTAGFGGLPGGIWQSDGGATDLQNDSASYLLIQTNVAPTLADDIDADNNGSAEAPVFTGWNVIDSINVLDGSANNFGYGAFGYRNNAGTGSSLGAEVIVTFLATYVGRSADTTGSAAADWVAGGALAGSAPNWLLGAAAEVEPDQFANQPLNHIGATNFDISPPTVQSITRASTNPTNAASVDFTVTFSENVTGVDAADFALTTTGSIAGASVGLIGAVGNVWTVTVNTGTGDGTIRLDLIDNNTIIDGSNNPLGGAGVQSFTTGEVYNVDKSIPTVNIVDVTPDPRSTSVSSISIVFSEAITGFDLADLSLTRNGGGNLLTGSQTLTSGDNITWTLGNLSTLTTPDGNYVLTLSAAAGITDAAGNAPAGGASDAWTMDAAAPTVDITDVTPDPRNTSVSSISIVFSEAVSGFDLADLTLTRDGGANLLTGAQTLTTGDNITFTLGNLSGLTGTGGTYLLTLTAPGGITDGGGNPLAGGATDTWVMDTAAPTVDITDVTPDPRTTSVSTISIVFNEAVTGFDISDLSLTRDAGSNLLTGSQTLTTSDNITWTLNNLSSLTGTDGNYALTLTSGGIADNAGNALAAGASDTWVVNGAAPTVDITDVTPDPRNTSVTSIAIVFSEAVSGFDIGDLSLTRNGSGNLLTGAQTLTSGDNINFSLGNLSALTGTDGSYTLTLTAPGGITDGGGASLASGATDSWSMDATGPTVTINQASGQADPTSSSPINFTVVFNEAVANFVTGDVTFSGAGATTATVTETAPNNGTTYNVEITGMNTSGTVTASLLAGVASDALGNLSQASTSTDNSVTFNLVTNAAPVLDNTGNMSLTSINEDVPNASNPGTLVADIILSAGGDRITDADAGAVEGIAVIAVDNTNGTWEFSINNGTNWFAFGSPNATTARLLASDATTRIRFVPNANFNGTVATGITFRAWDQTSGTNGNTADPSTNGGATAFSTATETASITVNSSNDAPTLDAIGDLAINEDAAQQTVNLTGIGAGGGESQTLVITATSGNTGLIPNPTVTYTSPNATGSIAFTPVGNQSGTALITVTVNDGGGTANGGIETVVRTFTVTVNAVNDGPVNTVPSAQSVPKNGTLTFSVANSNLISVADIDAGTLQVTLTATNGTLTLSGTTGLSFTVGDGTSDTTMTFTGTIANINNALNGLVFAPTNGYDGPATLQIVTNDQGNTGTGGALSDTDTINITVQHGGTLQFSSATYTVAEDGGNATITVNRTSGSVGTTQVDYTTSNGTATAGQDYTTASGTLIFGDGVTTQTFDVPITNDSLDEPDETINLTLSNVTGSGSLGSPATAELTVTDNDAAPTVSIGDVSVTEGNAGTVNAVFAVSLSAASGQSVTVNYQTANGTATAPGDYQAISSTVLTFNPGEISKNVTVLVNGETDVEDDETFFVNLSGANNATISDNQGQGTILNDDGTSVQFNSPAYSVNEGAGQVTITLTRTGNLTQAFTVDYETLDKPGVPACNVFAGLASERCDYETTLGTLSFASGQASATIIIPIVDDVHIEGSEVFDVKLSNAAGAVISGPTTETVTILENDTVFTQANPIDNFDFLLRMLYLDMLTREPDSIGFTYWKGRLTTCAADPTCSIVQERIRVSAGFFYSNEFLVRKGYFVYRFHRASLGHPPTYREFFRDMQSLGQVDAQEAQRRAEFTDKWVTRPEFITLYGGLTDTAFVNKLADTAAVTLDRPAMIAELGGGKTRAQLVRDVVENQLVYDKYFREAFVTANYFGFLRREPDGIGFPYWMNRVNQFPNDFRLEQHPELIYEVVGGFLYSEEYQFRFGNRNY